MLNNVVVDMMGSDVILWRCLHDGPLTRETMEHPKPHPQVSWKQIRARNLPLLKKLTDVYGHCAVVARNGEEIVGQLRFYPKVICNMAAIEAYAYADLPILYAVTGQAGKTFWEKLGFQIIETGIEPAFNEDAHKEFVAAMLKEASEKGLDENAAVAKYTMRLELT